MAGFKNKTKYTKHNQDVGVYLAREGRALSSRFWPYNLQSNIDVNDQKDKHRHILAGNVLI